MSSQIACSFCGYADLVATELAGKSMPCPLCGHAVIPTPMLAATPVPAVTPVPAANPVAARRLSFSETMSTLLPSPTAIQNRKLWWGAGAGVLVLLILLTGWLVFGGRGKTGSPGQADLTARTENPVPIGKEKPAPTDWIVVFRSEDPKIWNDDIDKGPNHYARALDLLPDTINHLKLTNMQTKDFVVLEITKQRLNQVTDENGRYGWEGRNHFHYNVYHLGIFNRIWPFTDGDVIITRHGTARGWGFGDLPKGGSVTQGYSWAGKPIPKTVFEIAVKAGSLTDAESKKLLKAGVVRE